MLQKCFAIDMDGTLLNEKKEISFENAQAIQHVQQNGHLVVIATGRHVYDARERIQDAGFDCPIIGVNGALISIDQQILRHISMDTMDVADLIHWFEEQQFYYEIFSRDAIYIPHTSIKRLGQAIKRLQEIDPLKAKELQLFFDMHHEQRETSFIDDLRPFQKGDIKVLKIIGEPFSQEIRSKTFEHFKQRTHLSVVSSSPDNVEVTATEATKGEALQQFIAHYGLTPEHTVCIGDSMNDVSMFEVAGTAIAMANAVQPIKEIAHQTTLSNEEHGVAHALYSFT